MNETFFDVLDDCLERERERRPAARLSPEVWRAWQTDCRPAVAPPPPPAVPPARPVSRPSPSAVRPPAPPAAEAPAAVSSLRIAAATLEEMAEMVRGCRRCRLCEQRTNAVFGEGNPHAELMFVGEGPGADEDRTGRPFVGRAGQLLDKMITAMTFRREEVYIANVVKCRPPNNRAPEPDEAVACIGYLQRQIELIRPRAIVCLGGVALTFLLRQKVGITRMRGRWIEFESIPVMPTFHPAFLLRQESAKREAWSDLQQVMKFFGRKRG